MQIITGTHAIEEMLKKRLPNGTILYVKKSLKDKNLENVAIASNVIVKKVDQFSLDKISPDNRGAVLAVNTKANNLQRANKMSVEEFCQNNKGAEKLFVLILDSITDPHNIGAILRSADSFNVDLVIIPKVRSGSINETVHRVSSGAASYVSIAESSNIVRDMKLLKGNGFWLYACDMGDKSIADVEYAARTCIVLGREGEGLHSLVKEECDWVISIPISGHVDSLNVSVAAGIFMCDYRMKNRLK